MLLFKKTVASWEIGLWWPILRTSTSQRLCSSSFLLVVFTALGLRLGSIGHRVRLYLTIGFETVLAHIRLTIHKIAERRSLKPENQDSIQFSFISLRIWHLRVSATRNSAPVPASWPVILSRAETPRKIPSRSISKNCQNGGLISSLERYLALDFNP